MKVVIGVLAAAVIGVAVWAYVVFSRPPPQFGNGQSPEPIGRGDLHVLAMNLLQSALAEEMKIYVDDGRFITDPDELGNPEVFVASPTVQGTGKVAVEVCEGGTVVVLGTVAADEQGRVFAVKARGLEPSADGEAVFSHYAEDPPCDAEDGPETWPGGYHVSRGGLMKGGQKVDVPLD